MPLDISYFRMLVSNIWKEFHLTIALFCLHLVLLNSFLIVIDLGFRLLGLSIWVFYLVFHRPGFLIDLFVTIFMLYVIINRYESGKYLRIFKLRREDSWLVLVAFGARLPLILIWGHFILNII